ncbi:MULTISPECIES: hypothetical protein [Deinococcus]|uniref:Uncharacterized protein n=1 Tax=Deinococcus ruber TaxID=1848197 RepID=A0A918CHK7_9DEIO|nr:MULTISPECIES: hypothetical protein [Deinococcus]ULH14348.1 hypothetical protein MF271_09835 [Deinococcus sp. KNUC1210]GGR21807.1 hypothetical protein GCM10008957_37610 [Deinococcus ruber]
MRVLDIIAESIRTGQAHPTTVLNALIEAENAGGMGAIRQVERQLNLSTHALRARSHPHTELAQAWLNATRAYLITQAELKRVA